MSPCARSPSPAARRRGRGRRPREHHRHGPRPGQRPDRPRRRRACTRPGSARARALSCPRSTSITSELRSLARPSVSVAPPTTSTRPSPTAIAPSLTRAVSRSGPGTQRSVRTSSTCVVAVAVVPSVPPTRTRWAPDSTATCAARASGSARPGPERRGRRVEVLGRVERPALAVEPARDQDPAVGQKCGALVRPSRAQLAHRLEGVGRGVVDLHRPGRRLALTGVAPDQQDAPVREQRGAATCPRGGHLRVRHQPLRGVVQLGATTGVEPTATRLGAATGHQHPAVLEERGPVHRSGLGESQLRGLAGVLAGWRATAGRERQQEQSCERSRPHPGHAPSLAPAHDAAV